MTHFYDDLNDPELVSVVDELSYWSAPFGIKLLDVVRYKSNMNVLDIGCGLGFPLAELSMRLGNKSKVYGIDPWKAGIKRIKQKIKLYELSNVEVIEGEAEKLPFEDNYFDLLVSNNGINNVKNLQKTFAECRRVSKQGAQFVFTFNTDQTFVEFYDVYRKVLKDSGMQEYQKKLDEHIYSKRRPVSEFKSLLEDNGFRIVSILNDKFYYRFSDASAMLDHFFMKLAFMPSWKAVIPEERREEVFKRIEIELNAKVIKSGVFTMQVPFVTLDCEKI